MMISNGQVQSILKQYASQKVQNKSVDKTEKKLDKKVSKFDEMLLSEQAKLHQVARKQISETDAVREAKIEQLQEAVRTGTYSVADEDIAEKMVARQLVDKLV